MCPHPLHALMNALVTQVRCVETAWLTSLCGCLTCCHLVPTPPRRTNLGFGESAGFACPRGDSPAARTAVITTNNMRSVLDREGTFVTVQAGMTMSDLIAYANSQQLTIPLGIVPGYTDLSVGGLLSTGGHANGPKGANALVGSLYCA